MTSYVYKLIYSNWLSLYFNVISIKFIIEIDVKQHYEELQKNQNHKIELKNKNQTIEKQKK